MLKTHLLWMVNSGCSLQASSLIPVTGVVLTNLTGTGITERSEPRSAQASSHRQAFLLSAGFLRTESVGSSEPTPTSVLSLPVF
ncbi:hypothetical protein BJ742DRAFT_791613 [Cladochytrium replicatum]|nr:hypothetical protein BJ742DRAFT_791613 [Cladochytrium replicatum]